MTTPFESPFIESLGATPAVIGVIGAVGSIILFLVRIPGSYMADKHGRRQIIVTMTYGVVLANIFFILAYNWIFYALGVVITNVCLIYQSALEAIEADSLPPEKRGFGYAAFRVLPFLPSIFSPLIAGAIISRFSIDPGMRIIYAIVLTVGLVAALLRHAFLKETLKEPKAISVKELKLALKDSVREIFASWALMPRSLVFLLLSTLIVAFTDPFFYRFGSLYVLQVVGLSEMEWSAVNAINLMIMLTVGLFFGKAIDVFGRKKALILAHLIFTPTTVFFILSKSFFMLGIVYAFFAIASVLFGPATAALQADIVPKKMRGRIMGSTGALFILATAFGSFVGGILYEKIGPTAPFLLCVPLDVAALLIVLFKVKEPDKKEA
ncbi:MFS transporter [Candidatus Bathyarchaeota archaeon]|nr:MFS transporter [Candidatus Bathyarchaeota archaeon]